MKRASQLESWTVALVASLATAVGVEVVKAMSNVPLWASVLLATVFPAVSTLAVTAVFAMVRRSARGRRLLAGSNWIEGYWRITTLSPANDTNPVSPGLMYVSYVGPDLDLSVIVYRVHTVDGRQIPKASESTLAVMRDTDGHFMNVCMQRYEQNEDKALGVGTFLPDGSQRYPTRYEGWMIRLTEGVYRIQVAERLSDAVVSENQKRFGSEWIVQTILGPSPQLGAPPVASAGEASVSGR